MRINLNVPYSEKDHAKRCGAKWDAAGRTWYVENVENLGPLMRWIPSHLKQQSVAVQELKLVHAPTISGAKMRKMKKAEQRKQKIKEAKNTHFIAGPVTQRTDFSLRDTGCDCPPWDWCQHNPDPSKLNTDCADGHKPDYRHVARQIEADNMAHIRSILAE